MRGGLRGSLLPEQLVRLLFGQPDVGNVCTVLKQLSVLCSSGQCQRTSGRARSQQWYDAQDLKCGRPPTKSVPGVRGHHERRQEKTPQRPPSGEAWERHLIKPATALSKPENDREASTGYKADHTKTDDQNERTEQCTREAATGE